MAYRLVDPRADSRVSWLFLCYSTVCLLRAKSEGEGGSQVLYAFYLFDPTFRLRGSGAVFPREEIGDHCGAG